LFSINHEQVKCMIDKMPSLQDVEFDCHPSAFSQSSSFSKGPHNQYNSALLTLLRHYNMQLKRIHLHCNQSIMEQAVVDALPILCPNLEDFGFVVFNLDYAILA